MLSNGDVGPTVMLTKLLLNSVMRVIQLEEEEGGDGGKKANIYILIEGTL